MEQFIHLQVAPIKVTLDDLDDLISALSPEELKELSSVDPDVSIAYYISLATAFNRNYIHQQAHICELFEYLYLFRKHFT